MKLLQNRWPQASYLLFLKFCLKNVSAQSNVFISKRQSSHSNKFYDRTKRCRSDFQYYWLWLTWLASSVSILHSDLITSAAKRNRGIFMFHWLLVAPQAIKNVLPVAGSFSNKEMRTFSRIRAHQSTRETMNTTLWRRKTKPASVNYFGVVVLAPNKICGSTGFRGPGPRAAKTIKWYAHVAHMAKNTNMVGALFGGGPGPLGPPPKSGAGYWKVPRFLSINPDPGNSTWSRNPNPAAKCTRRL